VSKPRLVGPRSGDATIACEPLGVWQGDLVLEYGSVADWVGALGTAGALIIAFDIMRGDRRTARREQAGRVVGAERGGVPWACSTAESARKVRTQYQSATSPATSSSRPRSRLDSCPLAILPNEQGEPGYPKHGICGQCRYDPVSSPRSPTVSKTLRDTRWKGCFLTRRYRVKSRCTFLANATTSRLPLAMPRDACGDGTFATVTLPW
jgi:hypothetical protein